MVFVSLPVLHTMVITKGKFLYSQQPTVQTGFTLGLTTHWVSKRPSSCPDLLTLRLPLALLWFVYLGRRFLFSPCCLLPWASALKSATQWPRHCHLSSSHQLCSTRHQHFGQREGTDGSILSLQVSTQPDRPDGRWY